MDELIWRMHAEDGMPVADIDRELHLARGTARDTVVEHWRRDKENGRPAARIREGK